MEATVKNVVEQVIGYPVTSEHEREVKETLRWLEFEHGPSYQVKKSISLQEISLYAEGALTPTHRIPHRVFMLIGVGETPYIYLCEECLAEAKEKRYDVLEEAPKEREAFLKWMEVNLKRVVESGGIPYNRLGRAIVFSIKHEDHIQRTKFCTRPDSPHHLSETIEEATL